MLKTTLYWISTAPASEILQCKEVVKMCLSMASQSSLECRLELLKGASCLTKPEVILAMFGDRHEDTNTDDKTRLSKVECQILKVCGPPLICLAQNTIQQSLTSWC